jgi:hypothetical protein
MLKISKIVKQYDKLLKSIDTYLDCMEEEKAGDNDEDVIAVYSKIIGQKFEMCESLHNLVVKIIEKYRAKVGQPPEYMMKIWAVEHAEYVQEYTRLKYRYDMSKK